MCIHRIHIYNYSQHKMTFLIITYIVACASGVGMHRAFTKFRAGKALQKLEEEMRATRAKDILEAKRAGYMQGRESSSDLHTKIQRESL